MSIEHAPRHDGKAALAYSIDEFVKVSGLGRSFIYEAIRNGDLTARKAGRRTLITANDAKNYISGLPPAKSAAA